MSPGLPKFLHSVAPTELGRLLDPARGTVLQDTGLFRIAPEGAATGAGRSVALGLEHAEGNAAGSAKLRASIALLRSMTAIFQFGSRSLRAVIGARPTAK